MRKDRDPTKYYLGSGTVQAYICRESPHFMYFFGLPEYDRDKPIITDHKRNQVQPILERLNLGEISQEEACRELDKIW